MERTDNGPCDVLRCSEREGPIHAGELGKNSFSGSGWSPFSSATDHRTLVARRRLLKAQQLAVSRVSSSSPSDAADTILNLVVQIAAHWAFAPASCEDLEDIANALLRLFVTASAFERLRI